MEIKLTTLVGSMELALELIYRSITGALLTGLLLNAKCTAYTHQVLNLKR